MVVPRSRRALGSGNGRANASTLAVQAPERPNSWLWGEMLVALIAALWFVVSLPFRLFFWMIAWLGRLTGGGVGVHANGRRHGSLGRPVVLHRHSHFPRRVGADAPMFGVISWTSGFGGSHRAANDLRTMDSSPRTGEPCIRADLPGSQRDSADGSGSPRGDAAVFPGGRKCREPALFRPDGAARAGSLPRRRWRGSWVLTRPR